MLASGQYQVTFSQGEIHLESNGTTKLVALGLQFLLDGSKVKVNPKDNLEPCFDLEEMTRRNNQQKG